MHPPAHLRTARSSNAARSMVTPSGVSVSAHREWWSQRCFTRLADLNPRADCERLLKLAAEMAETLDYFDPELAAEMEHEAGDLPIN